jgi:hypothetical protein
MLVEVGASVTLEAASPDPEAEPEVVGLTPEVSAGGSALRPLGSDGPSTAVAPTPRLPPAKTLGADVVTGVPTDE